MTIQPSEFLPQNQIDLPTAQVTLPNQNIYQNTQSNPSTAAVRTLDANVARVSPALYAAGAKTALTREEKNLLENWALIKTTHEKLMRMDNKKAGESFNNLEPGIQEALNQYYKIDYANKSEGSGFFENETIRKILGTDQGGMSFGDLVKSPFRLLMHAGAQYGKAINTVGNMVQNAVINRESFWSRKNISDSWDGKFLYDEGIASDLINKYGGAESFVAMHVLAGDTAGEIIDAWGPNDQSILTAINSMFNEPEAFGVMVDDFKRAQLSPGRNIARAFGLNTEEHKGLFKLTSGSIDMAYQIFADPLTYLTGGTSAVLKGGKAGKIAEAIKSNGDAVEQLTKNPEMAQHYREYAEQVGKYNSAQKIEDPIERAKATAEVVRETNQKFKNHNGVEELAFWDELGVKNYDSFVKAFDDDSVPAFTRLVRGKTVGTTYAREGAEYAKQSREKVTKAKESLRNLFTGKLDEADAAVDYTPEMRNALLDNRAAEVELTLGRKNQNRFQRFIETQTRRHPGRASVYHDDENVMKSIHTLHQQAYLALGRRDLADAVTADYIKMSIKERFALHKSIFELMLRKQGIHGMDGGQEFIDKQIAAHFAEHDSWLVNEGMKLPSSAGKGTDVAITARGPVDAAGFKTFVTSPDWRGIAEFKAGKSLGKREDQSTVEYVSSVIGGAYNNKVIQNLTDAWTALTLVPQLGIRSAIDEAFFFTMYANGALIKNYRLAKQIAKVRAATYGDEKLLGPIKTEIQNALGRVTGRTYNPAKLIKSSDMDLIREDMDAIGLVTKAERDAYLADQIFDMAIKAYAPKATELQQKWIKDQVLGNPNALHEVSMRNIIDNTLGYATQNHAVSLLSKAQSDESLAALGVRFGDRRTENLSNLPDYQVDGIMYRNFVRIMNDHGFDINGKNVSFAKTFLDNDGLEVPQQWAKATEELMQNFGFVKNTSGGWILTKVSKKELDKIINSSRFFDDYPDLDEAGKMLQFIETGLANVYHAFHGGGEQFNTNLLRHMQEAVTPSGAPKDYRLTAIDMPLEEYSKLTTGYKATGRVFTDLEWGKGTTDFSTLIRTHGMDKAFEWMSRQNDNISRQPITMMHYLLFREQYSLGETKMADAIFKKRMSFNKYQLKHGAISKREYDIREAQARMQADEQAARVFTAKASNDAAMHVLKFSDNPSMQSVFSYNVRTVGRFYRAIEDFHRRMYRLIKDHPKETIYKLRLMNQGLEAVGEVHTDQDGQQYVILPADNVIYSAVDSTLRTLTGGREGMGQPLFDNLTFNVTAANPSFQTDAGMPYLSGPMASLSVLTAKSILGKFDPTKNLAEDIDQYALGSLGDNVTLKSSITPKFVNQVWSMLSKDERSQQEVSALTQAISYNQANGYGINPQDPKYILPDGSVDTALFEKDKMEYIDNLRISAHNIIVTRTLLGMVLPTSVQLKGNKDLPDYLLDSGITSMQESFYDVLDEVKKKFPDANDPYEMALATWTGKNPGKVAYLVSKKDKEIQPAINYTNSMQDWAIKNKSEIDKYGSGALLFAPATGEFNPGVWKWASAAGIAKNIDIDNYYNKVLYQQYVNAYYDLETSEAEELNGLPFSSVQDRKAIVDKYKQQRSIIQLSVPGLEAYMSSGADNSDAFDFVHNAYNFATSPGSDVKPEIKNKIAQMYELYASFMTKADYIDSLQAANGSDLKRAEKEKVVTAMKAMIASDSSRVLEQYYNYGIKRLINAKSRDARAGVNRNVP